MYPRAWMYFTLAFALTVAAFFPSYFGRLGESDFAHHLHGVTGTLWFLLLVAQSWFVSHRRMQWHRVVGKASYVLAPLVIIGGLLMMQAMMSRNIGLPQELRLTLVFLDTSLTLFFAASWALAIVNRHNMQIHARCMVATIMAVLPPVLARFLVHYVPGVENLAASLSPTYFLVEAVLVALIVHDWRSGGRVRYPYPVALAWFAFQHLVMFRMPAFEWWQAYGAWVASWPI